MSFIIPKLCRAPLAMLAELWDGGGTREHWVFLEAGIA
jgi:hypothetical protein